MITAVGMLLIALGVACFAVGAMGLLRFPDVFTRLHAPTKADNLGLGLVVAGLALWNGASFESAKLLLVWLLVLPASGLGAFLVAREAERELSDRQSTAEDDPS